MSTYLSVGRVHDWGRWRWGATWNFLVCPENSPEFLESLSKHIKKYGINDNHCNCKTLLNHNFN